MKKMKNQFDYYFYQTMVTQENCVIYNLINTIDRMSIFNEIERRLSFINTNFLNYDISGEIDNFIQDIYDCDGVIAFTIDNSKILLHINGYYFVISRKFSRKRNMTDFYISRYDDASEAFEAF